MTFNTSIIIEEIIIKKNEEEIPFEWSYVYDNAVESAKTKELQLTALRIKDSLDFNNKANISDLAALDFLAIKGYIIPAQSLGNNPRLVFENVPSLIASKLLRAYFENFLDDTSLELKIKKQ